MNPRAVRAWLLNEWVALVLILLSLVVFLEIAGWSIPVARFQHTSQGEVAANGVWGWLGFRTTVEVYHETTLVIPMWPVAGMMVILLFVTWKIGQVFWKGPREPVNPNSQAFKRSPG